MISPTSALSAGSGINAVQRTSATSARSAVDTTGRGSSSILANLTADDRALIQRATAVAINVSGLPAGGGLVPKIALDVAMDRQAGRLPAGQPITATYLKNMLAALPASLTSTTESQDINHMLDVLGRRGAQDRVDLRA